MNTSNLLENPASVAGEEPKVSVPRVFQVDHSSTYGSSNQRRVEVGPEIIAPTLLDELQCPDHLRERATGIRWVIGFVRDDWRIRALRQLADQLEEAAVRLGQKMSGA